MKYVEIDLDDVPEYSAEEFSKLPSERRREVMLATLMNVQKRTFLMAASLLKYGSHLGSCTDPDECTCGYDPLGEMAIDIMETLGPLLDAKEHKVN